MALRLVRFCAVLLTALALVPAGAHLAELPNKIHLGREAYFTVQGIYRGWALFGVVLFGALFADLLLAILLRRRRRPAGWLALAGFLRTAATLAIFFTWTFPANHATANWTVAPADWEQLRTRWEYAHATNAVLAFLALVAVTLAVLTGEDGPGGGNPLPAP